MLDHALEAVAMIKGKIRADLNKDRQLNLALMRLLEIIGKAATRIHPIQELVEDPFPFGYKLNDITGHHRRHNYPSNTISFRLNLKQHLLLNRLPATSSDF